MGAPRTTQVSCSLCAWMLMLTSFSRQLRSAASTRVESMSPFGGFFFLRVVLTIFGTPAAVFESSSTLGTSSCPLDMSVGFPTLFNGLPAVYCYHHNSLTNVNHHYDQPCQSRRRTLRSPPRATVIATDGNVDYHQRQEHHRHDHCRRRRRRQRMLRLRLRL